MKNNIDNNNDNIKAVKISRTIIKKIITATIVR